MALPDSYPVKHVKAELMQTPGSSVVPASSLRHLREDSNSASPSTHDSAIPAKQPATHHVGPELFMRYLLQQPDETGAALPQPEPFITVVWAISLQSSPDIPEAAAMQQRVTAEYAANDLVFQLAVVGYVGESENLAMPGFKAAGRGSAVRCHWVPSAQGTWQLPCADYDPHAYAECSALLAAGFVGALAARA
jgi:hypothetical protein